MKNILKSVALFVCCLGLVIILQSCEEQGPAEKAGEKVDNVMEQAQEKLEEAGDKMKDAVEQGKETLEEASEDNQD